MEDMIIKGTGNSRWLKSVANIMTLYPTYESFAEALAAGTFPIDLNGINPAGVQTSGTRLNKANLLTDALCTSLGLSTTATPTQAMDKLRTLVNGKAQIVSGSYIGTGGTGASNPVSLTFPFPPKIIIIPHSVSLSGIGITEHVGGRSRSDYWILETGPLTETFNDVIGLGRTAQFAKKSSDGKTIYWYSNSTDAFDSYNSSYYRYYYDAIG